TRRRVTCVLPARRGAGSGLGREHRPPRAARGARDASARGGTARNPAGDRSSAARSWEIEPRSGPQRDSNRANAWTWGPAQRSTGSALTELGEQVLHEVAFLLQLGDR